MRAEARVRDVTSTLEGEHVAMTIDPGAMAHIMSVLTDLYSDPELAVIREYATNALDAHIEGGVNRPIEITLPAPLSPFFKVKDYGDGLDGQDIRNILSKYGASTKRDSNAVVGMLGLGSKSAMTYTDQFVMTGIKDCLFLVDEDDPNSDIEIRRMMTQVSYSRDENGIAAIDILYEGPTDDPTGVEVIVPAKRDNLFKIKAANFFRFWKPGTVLVNDEPPKSIGGVWIADDLLLTTETESSYVVMGNVAYPTLEDVASMSNTGRWNANLGRYDSTHVVAFVEIGDVSFTPSRESLQATPNTKKTLATIRDRVKKEKNPAFERIIAAAKDKKDALRVYHEVCKVGYDAKNPMWNGIPVPLKWYPEEVPATHYDGTPRVKPDGSSYMEAGHFLAAHGKKYRGQKATKHVAAVDNVPENYVWITNFEGAELTSYKREKLDQYVEKNNLTHPDLYILVKELPVQKDANGVVTDRASEWWPSDRILDWTIINQEKIIREKVVRRDGRPSGSYNAYVAGTQERGMLAAKIDTSKPLFYEHGASSYWNLHNSRAIKAVQSAHPDATIVILGGNRIAKFKRDFPQAREVTEYVRATAKSWAANLTDAEKLVLFFEDNTVIRSDLRFLAPFKDDLLDADLVAAIDLAMTPVDRKLTAAWDRWRQWGASYSYKFVNPLSKYALLTSFHSLATLRGKSQEHLHIYLNAAYTAEQEAAS
jgi:hypothetical protein